MQTPNQHAFQEALARIGISLEMSEARDGLSAFSTDGQRGYLVSPSAKGWRAEIVAPEHAMKTLFDGASKEEAALSCLCNEAIASGQFSEEIFLHQASGVQLRDSKLLVKGSRYADRAGNQIEIGGDAENRYIVTDAAGKAIGSFSDARLAIAYTAIATGAERATPVNAQVTPAPRTAIRPEETSFLLEVSRMPQLLESASGFARLDLHGKDPASGRPRTISLHGDRAKAMHLVLASRSLSEANPAKVMLEGRLKPRQVYDAATNGNKTRMLFEAVSAEVLPSAMKAPKQQDALVA